MSSDAIDRYLQLTASDGWSFRECTLEGEARWWLLSSKTARRKVELYLSFGVDGLSFQLPTQLRPMPGCHEALWRFLSMLNHELRYVKLTSSAEDAIYFAAELPVGLLSFAALSDALSALRVYFEHYHREIELLASDSDLATAWLSLSKQGTAETEPEVTLLKDV